MSRYITVWRKPENVLEWDFYTSENLDEAELVVEKLKKRKTIQYYTYPISDKVSELSSEF
jgi:hypothetical protein